jgi:DNA-directed RNA polymerase subunit RPC12/RpoP
MFFFPSFSCKCDCDDCSDEIKNHSVSAFAEYTLYPSHKLPKNDELMTCPNCQSAIITKKKYNVMDILKIIDFVIVAK